MSGGKGVFTGLGARPASTTKLGEVLTPEIQSLREKYNPEYEKYRALEQQAQAYRSQFPVGQQNITNQLFNPLTGMMFTGGSEIRVPFTMTRQDPEKSNGKAKPDPQEPETPPPLRKFRLTE